MNIPTQTGEATDPIAVEKESGSDMSIAVVIGIYEEIEARMTKRGHSVSHEGIATMTLASVLIVEIDNASRKIT